MNFHWTDERNEQELLESMQSLRDVIDGFLGGTAMMILLVGIALWGGRGF